MVSSVCNGEVHLVVLDALMWEMVAQLAVQGDDARATRDRGVGDEDHLEGRFVRTHLDSDDDGESSGERGEGSIMFSSVW